MNERKLEQSVKLFLESLGEDVCREGLRDTPSRFVSFFSSFTPRFCGSDDVLAKRVVKLFDEPSLVGKDQVVSVDGIPFFSLCEHHLMPFYGTVSVAYVPSEGKILGLSKFARIVDYFGKKLQTQERFTEQVATFLFKNIPCKWLKVIVVAQHMCMIARGAKALGSSTKTESIKTLQ